MLRPSFPELKCFAFEPPVSCQCSIFLFLTMESDFVVQFELGLRV